MTITTDYLISRYGVTITPKDAAKVLHQHPVHIRALCQSGKLPAVRIGDRWHIPTAKLAEIIEAGDVR